MRSILILLCLASPACSQWEIKNLALYEEPETSAAYWRERGVPMFTAEADLKSLWNGVALDLLTTQRCAYSDIAGWRSLYCRGGVARAEFDLILDRPMIFQWEMFRSPETTLTVTKGGFPVSFTNWVWMPVRESLSLQEGVYHVSASAVAIDHYDQTVRASLTIPVPESSSGVLAIIAFLLLFFVFGRPNRAE